METKAIAVRAQQFHQRPRHHDFRVALGLLLNTVVVAMPLVFLEMAAAHRLPVMLLFAGSALICGSELQRTIARPDRLSGFGTYHFAALAGALLLLLLQWGGLAELLHSGNVAGGTRMIIGIMLIIVGCRLRSAAIRKLDHGFCSNPSALRFVSDGIYSTMRHPSETGLLLASSGMLVLAGAWWTAVTVLPVSLVVAMVRIREEEQCLLAEFGDRYKDYCRRAGCWLPRKCH